MFDKPTTIEIYIINLTFLWVCAKLNVYLCKMKQREVKVLKA